MAFVFTEDATAPGTHASSEATIDSRISDTGAAVDVGGIGYTYGPELLFGRLAYN